MLTDFVFPTRTNETRLSDRPEVRCGGGSLIFICNVIWLVELLSREAMAFMLLYRPALSNPCSARSSGWVGRLLGSTTFGSQFSLHPVSLLSFLHLGQPWFQGGTFAYYLFIIKSPAPSLILNRKRSEVDTLETGPRASLFHSIY